MRIERFPPASRRLVLSTALAVALSDPAGASDGRLADLTARLASDSPRQRVGGGPFTASGLRGEDSLRFPPWLEGEWRVESNIVAAAAPLGRKYLPTDLARLPLGDLRSRSPPLSYVVRFVRRDSDGSIVSDREGNLRASQNAAAGFSRVDDVIYDGSACIKVRAVYPCREGSTIAHTRPEQSQVRYSEFGRNNTYIGPSRAEVYINSRLQSAPDAASDTFAFSETTRTVLLGASRSVSVSDAETLNLFTRAAGGDGLARQRVMRFLTPNPNGPEGVLWQEASGRAVALLDYELKLSRLPGE